MQPFAEKETNAYRVSLRILAAEVRRLQERETELTKALEPFAKCEVESWGSVRDEKVFLWKPNQTRHNSPGISIADIKTAKAVFSAETLSRNQTKSQ